MTMAKRISLSSSIALTSLVCLAACGDKTSDSGGFTVGIETNASADQGTDDTGDENSSMNGDGDPSGGDGDPSGGDGDPSGGDGDPTTSGGNTKFDLGPLGDWGGGGEGFGPGNCRASEIYGAAGNFPDYADPAYDDFRDKTIAIVSHRNGGGIGDNVITIVDISGDPPPPNMYYAAPLYWQDHWDEQTIGRIFGITLDGQGNMYVAPSTVFGATGNPNTVKRVDGITGQVSDFVTLPNNGPAFGNLNYDCVSDTIYISNHEDGRIYQVRVSDGSIRSTYRHSDGDVTMGMPNDPGEPNGAFVPLGDRVWAVQSHAGRLYYSVWIEHSNVNNQDNNSVWSVAYTGMSGVPDPGTAKEEFQVPNANNSSQPVSDISFAHDGRMLVAQRTMYGDMQTSAHQSTTFDYLYMNGVWVWQGTNFVVGELMPYSAAGGVDHDFVEDGYVWMTGDALDFYTPDVVYGLQGTPHDGGDITNSTLIDLDHEVTQQDKTDYGDVELPIPGDVSPVPPPG